MATKIQRRIGIENFRVRKPKLKGSKVNIPRWKKEVQMMTPTRIELTYATIVTITFLSFVAITDGEFFT